MKKTPDQDKHKSRRRSDRQRLESWKAIANYLNRSVRTVRRWETSENLPVHRMQHNKGHSVFAYCSELDAWRDNHDHPVKPEPASVAKPHPSYASVPRYAATAAAGVLGGVLLTQLLGSDDPSAMTGDSGESDWIVIAGRAGDANPDGLGEDLVARLKRQIADDNAYLTVSRKDVTNAILAPVVKAWTAGDVEHTVDEIDRIQANLPEWPTHVRNYTAQRLGDVALSLGRVQQARNLYGQVSDADRRQELQSRTFFAMGDTEGLRDHLRTGTNYSDPVTALLMSMSGLPDRATQLYVTLERDGMNPAKSAVLRASLARAQGKHEQAVQELEAAVGELTPTDRGLFYVGSDMLAMTLNKSGQNARAVDILETLAPHRTAAAYEGAGLFWMMCQHRLANSYRAAGRSDDADKIETRLRDMLQLADEDFPLRRNLFAAAI